MTVNSTIRTVSYFCNLVPIRYKKHLGPVVYPSKSNNRCCIGESFECNWQINDCNGLLSSPSITGTTPILEAVFTTVPSQPATVIWLSSSDLVFKYFNI